MAGLPDLNLLGAIVRDTSRELLAPASDPADVSRKADGSLVTAVDVAMQQAIRQRLQRHWPDYALLGEEMSRPEQQNLIDNGTTGLWCLDPLDGTSNFVSGLPYFSVSLALLLDGKIRLGIVYDPQRDELFAAIRGQGATVNGRPLRCRRAPLPLRDCIAVVDFKRLPTALAVRLVSAPPYRSQRSFGSVALDWCWLAASRYQIYLHGRQRLWDYAAGSLILAEAGGWSATLDGQQVYDQAGLEPRSAVAAVDEDLFAAWLDWLRQ
jgi:myo-inositol-1(or 4)-monophosphatase